MVDLTSWEILGFLALILLNTRAIPQIYKTIKAKHVNGISVEFYWMWFLGGLTMVTYMTKYPIQIPVFAEYCITTFMAALMLCLYYKYNKKEVGNNGKKRQRT